jgi:hypothetical protein
LLGLAEHDCHQAHDAASKRRSHRQRPRLRESYPSYEPRGQALPRNSANVTFFNFANSIHLSDKLQENLLYDG